MPNQKVDRLAQVNEAQPRVEHIPFLGAMAGAPTSAYRHHWVVPTGGARFTGIKIVDDTTLTAHAVNYWTFSLETVGGTTIASVDTSSTGLTADTARDLSIVAAQAAQDAATVLRVKLEPATGGSASTAAQRFTLAIEYQPNP